MPRKKLWGGRFVSEEDPFFAQFNDSLSFDRCLLEADIDGSLAYARALERAGVFTRTERLKVEKGLRGVLEENRKNPDHLPLFHNTFLSMVKFGGKAYELGLILFYMVKTGDLFKPKLLPGNIKLGLNMFTRGKLAILPPRIKGKAEIKRIFELSKKTG